MTKRDSEIKSESIDVDSRKNQEAHILGSERLRRPTTYSATVIHAEEGPRRKHQAMGFEGGWGAAFDQLVGLIAD